MLDVHGHGRTRWGIKPIGALLVVQGVCNSRKTAQAHFGRVVDGIRNLGKLQTLLAFRRDADKVLEVGLRVREAHPHAMH